MKKKSSVLKNYIAVTAIAYSLTVIIASLWSLITDGLDSNMGSIFFLQFLVVLILVEFVHWLLSLVCEKLWRYLITGYVVNCGIIIGAGFLFHWFNPTVKSVLICAAIILWISYILYKYSINKQKADSDNINKQLGKQD